jgi:hypothetical protein
MSLPCGGMASGIRETSFSSASCGKGGLAIDFSTAARAKFEFLETSDKAI